MKQTFITLSQKEEKELKTIIRFEIQKYGAYLSEDDITITPHESKRYYSIETKPIQMTPSVFKDLHIRMEGHVYEFEPEDISTMRDSRWRFMLSAYWAWESYSGGFNGTELTDININLYRYSDERDGYWRTIHL